MTIGGKYKYEYNNNPAPGQYEAADAQLKTRNNSPSYKIKQEYNDRTSFTDKRYSGGSGQSPGQYDSSHMTGFGNDSKGFTIGLKRNSKIERSPGPGDFDTEDSLIHTKPRTPGGAYIAEKDDFEERNSW
jgi:hypothetical protein